jgi:hypothetical protein
LINCFGEDSNISILDINCRTHDVNHLYGVGGYYASLDDMKQYKQKTLGNVSKKAI